MYYLSLPLTYQVLASTSMVHEHTCNRVLIHVTKNKQTNKNLGRKLRHSLLEVKGKREAGKPQTMTAAKALRRRQFHLYQYTREKMHPEGKEKDPGPQTVPGHFIEGCNIALL